MSKKPATHGGPAFPVVESELTVEQIDRIHSFGGCWINNYDPKSRKYWEKAFWLWAWDKQIIWMEPRISVPTGIMIS